MNSRQSSILWKNLFWKMKSLFIKTLRLNSLAFALKSWIFCFLILTRWSYAHKWPPKELNNWPIFCSSHRPRHEAWHPPWGDFHRFNHLKQVELIPRRKRVQKANWGHFREHEKCSKIYGCSSWRARFESIEEQRNF